MTFKVGIVISRESVGLFEEFGLKDIQVLNTTTMYSFATEAEAAAFRAGLDEAVGYMECSVKTAKPGSKISYIAFGSEDVERNKHTRINHESAAVRVAYEHGVMEGEGWMEYVDLDDDEIRNHEQAVAAVMASGEPISSENLVRFIHDPSDTSDTE